MSDPFAGLPSDQVNRKLDQILEEVSSYSVDIVEDPTLPELGSKYLQKALSQCRNFTNRVTFYLQAVMRLDKGLKTSIRFSELDLDFKIRALLADDQVVRQQSSIEDRKALAGSMLKAEYTNLDSLRVQLVDVEETIKILKLKHGELLRTSQDIKLQRVIVNDDKMTVLGGGEGFDKPQAKQDRSIPGGLHAPVTNDDLNPTDILPKTSNPLEIKPVDSVHARQINDFLNGPSIKSKSLCSICGEPQHETSSGNICKNGHGGAEPLENTFSNPEVVHSEPEPVAVKTMTYEDLLD